MQTVRHYKLSYKNESKITMQNGMQIVKRKNNGEEFCVDVGEREKK